MYCQVCGKQNPDTATFCRYCGVRNVSRVIEAAAPAEESGPVQITAEEPVIAPPQDLAAEVREPEAEPPQDLAAEVQEPEAGPQRDYSAEASGPVPPEAGPQSEPFGSEKQADDLPDNKDGGTRLYVIGTGVLTALVSILLIPCTAAFFVLVFLNALTKEVSFPALGGIAQSAVNNFLGAELTVILAGVVCLLLVLDIFLINRKYVGRAFLAFGVSLLIVGAVSFGLSLTAAYIVDHLVTPWYSVLWPAVPAFSQVEVFFGLGWCVTGAAMISIHLCIRALQKKPNLVLDRRSKVFPVIVALLHIITVLAVGAGVFLTASGSLPF